jgi:uncharacterized hydrophobic protein (TIGR00271 family)
VIPSPGGQAVIVADIHNPASERVVKRIEALDIDNDSYVITRLEVVAPDPFGHAHAPGEPEIGWLELLGRARSNSRPLARYLALMAIAGLIAALGVIRENAILIVGAMAVSPDLLPISAAAVGIVTRRMRLALRALATLIVGLALVGVVAAALTFLLDGFGLLEAGFAVEASDLGGLTTTDYSTALIALAAGVAAMLTFETRASAAVGVAISVTTIPASTYFGVAVGAGEAGGAWGALVVLAVNVTLLLLAATATLATQGWLGRRAARAPA